MSKALIFSGIAISLCTLVTIGFKNYRKLQALRFLKMKPGKPAILLSKANDRFIDGFVNLEIDNPTSNDYHIKNFVANIESKSTKVELGALRLAEGKVSANATTVLPIGTTIQVGQLLDLAKNIFLSSGSTAIFLTGRVTYVANGIEVPYPFTFEIDVKEQLLKLTNPVRL